VPPRLLPVSEADAIAWAWAIYFVVLALVYATDTGSERVVPSEPDEIADYPESQPPMQADPVVRAAIREPTGEPAPPSLPEVQSLQEARDWFQKGSEQYARGRYLEAASRFDKALKLYPRLAGAWAGKGLAANALGQYQDAIRFFDESLRLDPRDPAVWHDKGNALSAVGRLEGALNCYNETLIIDPRNARAWNNKGVCLASLGRPDEAVACCDRALALDKSYLLAWQAKAAVEERLGHIENAIAAYRQFIALAPDRTAPSVERIQRYIVALESSPRQPSGSAT